MPKITIDATPAEFKALTAMVKYMRLSASKGEDTTDSFVKPAEDARNARLEQNND